MENTAALNSSGITLTEANRPYEAISLFQKALAVEPENPLLWLNLGIAQQKTGEYETALKSFINCIQIDNEMATAWGAIGLIYYELEQLDKAEDYFQESLLRDRNSPKVWNNLGVLYFNLGSYEEARDCFEEAITLNPQYYDALYNIRDTCRELEDYKAAAVFERILMDITPGSEKISANH